MTEEELGFNLEMDTAVKGAILDGMKNDPVFKRRMIELINKRDEADEVHVLTKPNTNEYIITSVKRKNEWSVHPIGELMLNGKLLKELYEQLIDMDKKGNLK